MNPKILWTINYNVLRYKESFLSENNVYIPPSTYEQISETLYGDIYGLIQNDSFRRTQIPILVKLHPCPNGNENTMGMSQTLFSVLLGSTQLDTDKFTISVISNVNSLIEDRFGFKNYIDVYKSILNREKTIDHDLKYYQPWENCNLEIRDISIKVNPTIENLSKKPNTFFSALENFYISTYICPTCGNILYKTIFKYGNEYEIWTKSKEHPHIKIKRLFTCPHCQKFFTPGLSKLSDKKIFIKECVDFTEYKEEIIEINRISTLEGRSDSGIIDI